MYELVLTYKGKKVDVKTDGSIGNIFQEKTNLELQIAVPVDSAIKPMHLVKKGGEFSQVEMKTNYYTEKFRVHTAVFSVQKTQSGYPRAIQNHNGKNFVLIDCGDGIVRKVGIVSQAGKFYLLDREICKEPEREAPESDSFGVVEWFDVFSGVGCLRIKNGQTRFYWDCLLDERGLVEPKPGEWIVFSQLGAPSVATAFQREIIGVAIRFADRPAGEALQKALSRLAQMSNTDMPTFTVKLGDIAKIRSVPCPSK